MTLKELRYSVLVVSAAESFNSALGELLPCAQYEPVIFASSVSAAKRMVADLFYDIVIVNAPLPDDMGTRFAVDTCSAKGTVVLLLVKGEIHAEINGKVRSSGVFTLPKPTSKSAVAQALNWLISARERLRGYEKKTLSIEEKMEEIRLVNRAKWLLITELKMDEPDAHRYIEKQAMDACVPKRDIAQNIIKAYS